MSSSSLSNSCSFKKTVTWLEKVFAQSHPRSCTPWEADEMSDKPILQGHMTHFSITWPLTISPLVFSLCRVCPIPHTTTRGRPTVVWWRPTTEISRRKIEKLKKWSRNRCCPNKFWTRNSSLLSFIYQDIPDEDVHQSKFKNSIRNSTDLFQLKLMVLDFLCWSTVWAILRTTYAEFFFLVGWLVPKTLIKHPTQTIVFFRNNPA